MSDTDLSRVKCPKCKKLGLWANTHTHGSVSHILRGLACPRRSCGWRVDNLCPICQAQKTSP